ncbi:MAG: hypothetical protein KatS3mg110_3142 [Pirellulaceae bacterium]|nr:MAG: hypothetical protein KatS3mg110_3142 [Pirellulaceae bacterium]
MLDWVEFENYRCLRQCRLQLDRLNLLVGPNGSGKSTVLEALGDLQQVAQNAGSAIVDINDLLRRRTLGAADSSWVLVRTAIVDSQEEVGLEWFRQDERHARESFWTTPTR